MESYIFLEIEMMVTRIVEMDEVVLEVLKLGGPDQVALPLLQIFVRKFEETEKNIQLIPMNEMMVTLF
jgi:hypothetical protein